MTEGGRNDTTYTYLGDMQHLSTEEQVGRTKRTRKPTKKYPMEQGRWSDSSVGCVVYVSDVCGREGNEDALR